MGKGFGELAKVRGVVYHMLSPFEQKAFAGVISHGVPNTIRRLSENFWTVVPPFVISYLIFTETEKEHARLQRKNPEDYKCET